MRDPILYSMFMDNVDRKANFKKPPSMKDFLFRQLDKEEYRLKLEQELEQKSTKDNSESQKATPGENSEKSENETSSLEDVISKIIFWGLIL